MSDARTIVTLSHGITRHTKRRAEETGLKWAVDECDRGAFDWTTCEPIKSNR